MLETAPDQVDLEKLVHQELRRLLVERDRPPGVIEASSRLGPDLGFESLDLALLVARLEVATGLDPFVEDVAITSIRTVGDVVSAYRHMGGPAADGGYGDDDLVALQHRTRSRGLQASGDGSGQ
jgi:acyl carrier protein